MKRFFFTLCFCTLCLFTALIAPLWASVLNPFAVSPLETRVLGQNAWLRGGPAALRVIVLNHATGRPVSATITLALKGPKKTVYALWKGRTSTLGTVDAAFKTPAVKPGAYTLNVEVVSPLGDDTVTQAVTLAESVQTMLSSDKPLYQPGQTMHLRALALDTATRQPLAGTPLTFEVEDARGNKVFKKPTVLSRYGVASADFVLADEVNGGSYTLRTVLRSGQAEKTVRVERYVLPKFKASVTTDKPYYLPGETVHGTVEAHYFFGKPVASASVTLTVNTVDIGVTKLGELSGKTNDAGKYTFEYTLPTAFVGQPFEQGKAVVEFAGKIKDTADQTQETHTSLPVVREPILLVMVPEHRGLVPGVENRVYLAAATPDGQPVPGARLTVNAAPEQNGGFESQPAHLRTDALGLATYAFVPDARSFVVTAAAEDASGHTAITTQTLGAAPSEESLILRADKTLTKVGERLHLAAVSSVRGGTLYVDVIRNKQTILTRALDMKGGQAGLTLPVTDDMAGTIEIHAYKILPNEDIVRDTRTIIVAPADDLTVKIRADQAEYKPGGEAVLHFAVTDPSGAPVQAALGLAMVDESVFALSELQPGLEKVYFTLEKELMAPKYEIHGLTPSGLFLEGREDAPRQRAAAMLLASAPATDGFEWRVNTYQVKVEKVKAAARADMVKRLTRITAALTKYQQKEKTALTSEQSLTYLVDKGYLKQSVLVDPWGHWYRANVYGRRDYDNYWTLSSAGPDGVWGTPDDIPAVPVYVVWSRHGGGGFPGGGAFGGGMVFNGAVVDEQRRFKVDGAMDMAMPAPMAAAPFSNIEISIASTPNRVYALQNNNSLGIAQVAAPRVRSYFPETMYWNPSLITDDAGQAEVRLPMADSITTWRLSMLASGLGGQLGSATAPVKVFQDFFVDIDLPTALTQHDSVEIPVTVYNYLPHAQDVTLTLAPLPWFTQRGPSVQTLSIGPGEVKVVYYPITVVRLGHFALTVTARGTTLSDAVRREIDVLPDGKRFDAAVNDRFDGTVEKTITIPKDALPEASKLFVKLYPGTFSQIVEGLDGLLQMPGGCFEQTSSTTYPDVLVLDYLKQTKKINPELQMKAEGYINVGYQRLVTFECKNGGFSWFGDEPAHQILTAYGLLEFSDMARVHDVDPNVIARTQRWLAGRQLADGSWNETHQGIAEGIINRQTGALRTTAYVAWALAESGYDGPELTRGVGYVKAHLGEANDAYTLAVILNLLARTDKNGADTAGVAEKLIGLAKTTDKTAYWQGETQTFTGAQGVGADVETTGLAAYGLLHWGRNAGFTEKVLTHLVQSKDSSGTWGTTQGTVWSLKSLLYASRNAAGGGSGTVTILVNGQPAQTFTVAEADSDVMRQADLSKLLVPGDNTVRLEWAGSGAPLYQIATRWYQPWVHEDVKPATAETGPLTIRVAYDKTQLAADDTATVTATIKNVTDKTAEMPLIDLGLPPGFTLQPEGLETAVENKTISKYTQAAPPDHRLLRAISARPDRDADLRPQSQIPDPRPNTRKQSLSLLQPRARRGVRAAGDHGEQVN